MTKQISVEENLRSNREWTTQKQSNIASGTRHRTKTNKNTTQKTKKMTNMDPTKQTGGEPNEIIIRLKAEAYELTWKWRRQPLKTTM